VSFVYNLGEGALAASTLLKLLNAGDYVGASEQFIRWDHVGGIENAGLLNRRKSERSLFLKPDAEDDCPATDPGA
jgi:lysozyme